ncbi:MAG: SDR family NAD(P)-dependent oxidoreductase [Clostridia bacterium]|jgi:short-subunit dehydrogenase|nr:SDR family NAD(P)-dependent oxidoreductase [Clostridia bacterium]MBP5765682.1 SDR family NAD(P)-dependent oxidoreductase [Clostridia bacterium]
MKIAVVTGASSGMGRDFVYAVDREFELDEIWVVARRRERLEELAATGKCRAKIRPVPLDLSQTESYNKYKELLEAEKPDIHVLVNAAGYGLFGTFTEMDVEDQLGIVDVNDKALTAFCGYSLPYMKEGAKIINMGSNSSWQPVPYIAVYAASKAYVLSFSRALGRELKTRGIHVMCVCPGWIKTEFMDRAVHDNTIKYYDRWYTSEQVVEKAMKDLRKKKKVSILGFPVRSQVRLVKILPTDMVMNTWCRQQGKK